MVSSRTGLTIVCAALALMACATPPEPAATEPGAAESAGWTVRGALSYPERVALPPDTEVVVEVRSGEALRAEQRIPLAGRQVPVAFRVRVPDDPQSGVLTLRAGALSPSGAARLTAPVAVAPDPGENVVDLGTLRLQSHAQAAFGTAYRCGDESMVFGRLGTTDYLITGGRAFALEPAESASGARYRARATADTGFWSKGETARVTVSGSEWPECDSVTSLLTGEPWIVRELDGRDVAAADITVGFDRDGRIAGRGGCNQYTGTWRTTAGGVHLDGPLTTTLMACADARMEREAALFAVLENLADFRRTPDGELILIADDGARLTARRPALARD